MTSSPWLPRIVLVLALLEAGWLAFDGGRALIVGDYVTPRSGPHTGQLGPWSKLVAAVGIEPRSTHMKTIHVGLGVVWLAIAAAYAVGEPWAARGMLACAILGLWYLPIGTVLSLAQVVLLLVLRRV
ncbi:MAG TPA: hypothetical protein VFO11_09515 [Candidatus Polarisedimenticolaceae bacterium]|nr:hypothetical protein [Candidatus Polarisedimenticolaceae bacterium]